MPLGKLKFHELNVALHCHLIPHCWEWDLFCLLPAPTDGEVESGIFLSFTHSHRHSKMESIVFPVRQQGTDILNFCVLTLICASKIQNLSCVPQLCIAKIWMSTNCPVT